MAKHFMEFAFTDSVRKVQESYGTRAPYGRHGSPRTAPDPAQDRTRSSKEGERRCEQKAAADVAG